VARGTGWQPPVEPANVTDLRFACEVEQSHGLGERNLFESLSEPRCAKLSRNDLEQRVQRYIRRRDVRILVAIGADRLAARRFHLVGAGK
jgi:hypothetical protein